MTREQFRKIIEEINSYIHNETLLPGDLKTSCVNQDFSGWNFDNINFFVLELVGCNFTDAIFNNCTTPIIWSGSDFRGASFLGCNIMTSLDGNFSNTKFSNCIFYHSKFREDHILKGAIIHDCNFENCLSVFNASSFEGVKINNCNFSDGIWMDCKPSECPECFVHYKPIIRFNLEDRPNDENHQTNNEQQAPLTRQQQLDLILDKHQKWLNNEDGGEEAVLKFQVFDGLSFAKRNLSKISFVGSSFRGSDFSGATFTDADFSGAHLGSANFNECTFNGSANFTGAYCYHCQFEKSSLMGAIFNNIYAKHCDFEDANLNGAIFEDITNFTGISFKNADLSECRFSSLDIEENVDFTGAKTQNLIFGNDVATYFTDEEIPPELAEYFSENTEETPHQTIETKKQQKKEQRRLSRQKKFDKMLESHEKWLQGESEGEEADFKWKNFEGIKASNKVISNLSFAGANLEGSCFEGCTFNNVDFKTARLAASRFDSTMFSRGTDFTRSGLACLKVSNSSLIEANFQYADLWQARLESSDLSGVRFVGCCNLPNHCCHSNLEGAFFEDVTFECSNDYTGTNIENLKIGDNVKIAGGTKLEDLTPELLAYNVRFNLDFFSPPPF